MIKMLSTSDSSMLFYFALHYLLTFHLLKSYSYFENVLYSSTFVTVSRGKNDQYATRIHKKAQREHQIMYKVFFFFFFFWDSRKTVVRNQYLESFRSFYLSDCYLKMDRAIDLPNIIMRRKETFLPALFQDKIQQHDRLVDRISALSILSILSK